MWTVGYYLHKVLLVCGRWSYYPHHEGTPEPAQWVITISSTYLSVVSLFCVFSILTPHSGRLTKSVQPIKPADVDSKGIVSISKISNRISFITKLHLPRLRDLKDWYAPKYQFYIPTVLTDILRDAILFSKNNLKNDFFLAKIGK